MLYNNFEKDISKTSCVTNIITSLYKEIGQAHIDCSSLIKGIKHT